ncbi:MAG: hypothetical protein JW760_02565 [Spirochaetales bacterium]|nr:hypothetical protein [Spirochaetales bacterium]
MKKSLITAARSPAFGLFKDRETDWTFRRTLEFLGEKGHIVSARECFLRASNYFRTAEYGTSPAHPRFEPLGRPGCLEPVFPPLNGWIRD